MYFVNTFDVCVKHYSKKFPKLKVYLSCFGALLAKNFWLSMYVFAKPVEIKFKQKKVLQLSEQQVASQMVK